MPDAQSSPVTSLGASAETRSSSLPAELGLEPRFCCDRPKSLGVTSQLDCRERGQACDPLTIFTRPSSSAVLGSAALLKCRFNIGGPINLTALQVHWYFSDQSVAQYDRGEEIFAPGVSISKQELLMGNASLGMENVQMSDEGQYTCVVGYGAERQESETTLRVLAAPRLSIPRRAARTDTATSFPCHVWGFYPGDVTVTWLRDGRVLTDATRSAPQRNPDGTFNLTLTHTFTPTASDSGSIFSCHVSHAALAQPLREEFPLDVTAAPRISIPQRSGTKFTTTSFPCHVWGFYPRDIAVTWLRDGRVWPESTYSPLQRNPDGTFNLTLTYTFTPTFRDRGSILTCRVSHSALGSLWMSNVSICAGGMIPLGDLSPRYQSLLRGDSSSSSPRHTPVSSSHQRGEIPGAVGRESELKRGLNAHKRREWLWGGGNAGALRAAGWGTRGLILGEVNGALRAVGTPGQ
ncbi:signal-regulatory protein beta-1-like [Malaclemys terrapin pileata]|uniref:signal-regulatory protein beta-1-like n=1 Tax=Malaclemys terrapin pileata TaxID=2991368 RepID=UPI0023A89E22|nr:signal-regulatory protein beta-1-like [Malaclemys terrapin pileata]